MNQAKHMFYAYNVLTILADLGVEVDTYYFSYLLNKIFQKNFVSIDEMHPPCVTLTKKLSELKRRHEDVYSNLQDEFAQIFDNIRIKIEEKSSRNAPVEEILSIENKKTFRMNQATNMFYAYTILTILVDLGIEVDTYDISYPRFGIRALCLDTYSSCNTKQARPNSSHR